ncbi:MAG: DUF1566 domain-containing protein [Desulfoarculaceae bacterium]|nr:DUF1566 domain-containing protein [Desulfoarculaceae bacterium]
MKHFSNFRVVFALLLTLLAYAFDAGAADVNVIYVNGIQNTRPKFQDSLNALNGLLTKSVNHTGNKISFKVVGLYNPIGYTGSTAGRDSVQDNRELFLLKTAEEFYRDDLANISVGFTVDREIDKDIAKKVVIYLDDMTPGVLTNYQEYEHKTSDANMKATQDVANNLASGIESLGSAVVVAHSEGNLLANLAYAKIASKYGTETTKMIRVVNVANTSEISVNNLNFTHNTDRALFPGLLTLPTTGNSLAWPTDLGSWWRDTPVCRGTCNFIIDTPTCVDAQLTEPTGHNFINTYLSTATVTCNDPQGVSFTSGKNRFRDRFEDFVYAAANSLLLANQGETTYSLSGIIHSDSDTGPVLSGATVSIAGKTAISSFFGTFSISGIPSGSYALSISKPGYNTDTNPYSVGSDESNLNFYLTQPSVTYALRGTIHSDSDTGPALSGATVSIAGYTATSSSIASSIGEFSIAGIPPGTYPLSVSKPGYATYTNPAYYVYSDQSYLNFYLTVASITPAVGRLPDTGQTHSYTDTFGEDSDYTINPPSYTDNNNGTVSDNVTGFMWQQDNAGGNSYYNWYQAAGVYDASYNPTTQDVCGAQTTGGYSDWRLPTKKELTGIVDYGRYASSSNPIFGTIASDYWSSTTFALDPDGAWLVDFDDGGVYNGAKSYSFYVRCVRGGQ